MRILVDMDDVMADCRHRILEIINERNNLNVTKEFFNHNSFHEFMQNKELIGYRDQLYAEGFFFNLPVMPDAQETMKYLNDNFEVFIVSAAMEFPQSLTEKYYWLEKHFPFITWQQIILCGDKTPIVGDYLLDDHDKNLKNFKGTPLLFDAIHNKNETKYRRLNNWKEVMHYFKNEI